MTIGDSRAPAVAAPREGDVVVARDSRSGGRYVVRQVPGDVQLTAAARDEAVRIARGFARQYSVDLWYRENGVNGLLESYRAAGGARRAR